MVFVVYSGKFFRLLNKTDDLIQAVTTREDFASQYFKVTANNVTSRVQLEIMDQDIDSKGRGDYKSRQSQGGILHGGVPPVGRVHLGLSRVVFGNAGGVGRVEGSA
jgi:hypothetical protein